MLYTAAVVDAFNIKNYGDNIEIDPKYEKD